MSSHLRNTSTLSWMDFSGSPLLVLPQPLEKEWLGFYAEAPTDFRDDPDFWLDEVPYILDDTFDFAKPRTDYDCICGESKRAFAYLLETGHALVLHSFYDTWAWLPERQLFINGHLEQLNEALLDALDWQVLATWTLSDPSVFMMNACCCTQSPDLDAADFLRLRLPIGIYQIQSAHYEDPYCAVLFRLVLVK